MSASDWILAGCVVAGVILLMALAFEAGRHSR